MNSKDVLKAIRHPSQAYEELNGIVQQGQIYREVFINQVYYWLYSKIKPGTTVIDIGASYADTAIYFAMNLNVNLVIAFEPDKKRVPIIEKNLKSTALALSNKIHMLNQGLNNWPELQYYLTSRSIAIKCDCEGAEHKLFTEDLDLARVYTIELEYHHGVQKLKKILESKGFHIQQGRTYKSPVMGDCGYLRAIR